METKKKTHKKNLLSRFFFISLLLSCKNIFDTTLFLSKKAICVYSKIFMF